jgi:hypothetical protein
MFSCRTKLENYQSNQSLSFFSHGEKTRVCTPEYNVKKNGTEVPKEAIDEHEDLRHMKRRTEQRGKGRWKCGAK